jgi:hypothetical protein
VPVVSANIPEAESNSAAPAASGMSIDLEDRIRDLEQSLREERRAYQELEQKYQELVQQRSADS